MDTPTDSSGLRGILNTTTVGELTQDDYPVLTPQTTVAEAVAAMRQSHHGSALICDQAGLLVGIFTERDFLRVINESGTDQMLSEVMTPSPKTVTSDDTLLVATRLLASGGYRRLPVVNADGQPAGVLDVKAISHFVVEHFPEAVYNQAAHAKLIAQHREGA